MRLRIISLLSLVALMVVLARPAYGEDSPQAAKNGDTFDTTNSGSLKTVKIGNTVVQIQVTNGSAYIIVKSGGPLNMTYADGSPMCSLQDGQGIAASGFIGDLASLSVKDGSLALGPAVNPVIGVGNGSNHSPILFTQNGQKVSVAPGGQSPLSAPLTTPGAGESLKPGQVQKIGDTDAYEYVNADGTIGVVNNSKDPITVTGTDGTEYTFQGKSTGTLGGGGSISMVNGKLTLSGGTLSGGTVTQGQQNTGNSGPNQNPKKYTFNVPAPTNSGNGLESFLKTQFKNYDPTSDAAVSASPFH